MSQLPFLPAEGSMAAHDALIDAFLDHAKAERTFEAAPTAEHAACADMAWNSVVAHAVNCGMPLTAPSVLGWVTARVASYTTCVVVPCAKLASRIADDAAELVADIALLRETVAGRAA